MSKRFAPLPQGSTLEPINWGDPGDYRNRANAQCAKLLPAIRPDASAQTAKATKADKPKPSAPVSPPKPTTAELVAKAKADARAKVATVKACAAYAGRESTARNLLLNSSHSAAEIVKTLAASPTDAQLTAVDKHLRDKEADKAWARAYGIPATSNASDSKPEGKSDGKYDAMWTKAYSRPKIAPGNPA